MWVLTEDGELVNVEQMTHIRTQFHGVWAFESEAGSGYHLCSCDDEEHGKEIVARLASRIAQGGRLIIMGDLTYRGVECRECGELYCDCQGLAETA